ncbi:MAG: MFS transporter [Chitinophagia bacterium]|jgi:UMF1 family MFS transporter|nr:MFS transporter [Chitinophagia bacterium]
MQTASKKVVNGWAMYDWANSVYNLVITSTIFPAYYEAVTGDGNENTLIDKIKIGEHEFSNTALYNYILAIAFVIVAIMSPILSSIADYRGNKKQFLRFFCTMGSLSCASLYFFDSDHIMGGLISVIIACVGFWSSLVFYNSYLPEIAAPEDRDRISAKGFMMGYIGSVLLQIICFVFVLKPELFGITVGKASQISFLLVGVWWVSFGWLAISRLPASKGVKGAHSKNLITQGYKELHKVWIELKTQPLLKQFLLSFFFYNMGVQTVMLAATLYGKSELNIPTTNLIIAILIIQLVAIPGAHLMAKLASKWGNFNTIMVAILIWIGGCIIGYYLPRNGLVPFYCLSIIVGFVMGGIQSVSRSTYSKLMPETHDTTSYFSFYDVTEKVAIVIGMFSFGFINEITGSQRNSVLALCIFFIIGFVILYRTSKLKGHAGI